MTTATNLIRRRDDQQSTTVLENYELSTSDDKDKSNKITVRTQFATDNSDQSSKRLLSD